MSWRQLLSSNLMNQPLPASNFAFAASSPLSAFTEESLGFALSFKEVLWLIWSSVQTTTFPRSSIKLFHFYMLFTGAAILIFFKHVSFAFTIWLAVRPKSRPFEPVLAFNMPSSVSLIMSSVWFKVRDMQLLLFERFWAIMGLLIGLIPILLCLKE